jgi:hypothetical protein
MVCLICRNLKRAFEIRNTEYIEARSSLYYRISRKFAARKNVDMERAKSDLEEHRRVCASAVIEPALLLLARPVSPRRARQVAA